MHPLTFHFVSILLFISREVTSSSHPLLLSNCVPLRAPTKKHRLPAKVHAAQPRFLPLPSFALKHTVLIKIDKTIFFYLLNKKFRRRSRRYFFPLSSILLLRKSFSVIIYLITFYGGGAFSSSFEV